MKTAKTYNEFASGLVSFHVLERVNGKGKKNTCGEGFDDAVSSSPKITENIFH